MAPPKRLLQSLFISRPFGSNSASVWPPVVSSVLITDSSARLCSFAPASGLICVAARPVRAGLLLGFTSPWLSLQSLVGSNRWSAGVASKCTIGAWAPSFSIVSLSSLGGPSGLVLRSRWRVSSPLDNRGELPGDVVFVSKSLATCTMCKRSICSPSVQDTGTVSSVPRDQVFLRSTCKPPSFNHISLGQANAVCVNYVRLAQSLVLTSLVSSGTNLLHLEDFPMVEVALLLSLGFGGGLSDSVNFGVSSPVCACCRIRTNQRSRRRTNHLWPRYAGGFGGVGQSLDFRSVFDASSPKMFRLSSASRSVPQILNRSMAHALELCHKDVFNLGTNCCIVKPAAVYDSTYDCVAARIDCMMPVLLADGI